MIEKTDMLLDINHCEFNHAFFVLWSPMAFTTGKNWKMIHYIIIWSHNVTVNYPLPE